ncbi:DUF4139 domain-containing protein [Frigidibacter sp.]|uniref:DUF4139 domain-containing protein n=1 Tax=Frigidibacter sp. TaxID=2586418 RepID=UPI002733B9BC|nr:DUF4139 domain-containing protein [Frigidibacter sp.]MDP3339472.1 DUF4139 domain-containing protein [Frigidibacter sp.]
MRLLPPTLLKLALLMLAAPAAAETFTAEAKVARVTLYPWGATVTRELRIDAPAGQHELIVPNLPLGTDPASLRVAAPALKIGAVSLAQGRLAPVEPQKTAAVLAAEAEVERLEEVVRSRDAGIATIRLRADAAGEQLAFLRGIGSGDEGTAPDPARLRALAQMVGEEALAAFTAAHRAEQEALAAERAREEDIEALEAARAALDALVAGDGERAALSLAFEGVGGEAVVEITSHTASASWEPVYDLRLTRGDAPALAVERAVLARQQTGEDWLGVELTFSTARPAERSAPGELWPELLRVGPPQPVMPMGGARMEMEADMVMAAPAPEAMMERAEVDMQGATVTWRYAGAVDLRDGADALRLRLGDLTLAPELQAVAVPRLEQVAYLQAEVVNDGTEPLLPGPATLFVDGAMVGQAYLPMVAAGDEVELGFGPIDGIVLDREVPARSGGDRGVISRSERIDEVAVLRVQNLTGEAWPVRLIDRIPYSEQEDLTITSRATPPATETDPEGRRGILVWEFDLGPGAEREVRLEHSLSWPADQVLQ